ncbi:MAG: ComEC/Rec2 family competence protein [Patescibacteria group bacterium]
MPDQKRLRPSLTVKIPAGGLILGVLIASYVYDLPDWTLSIVFITSFVIAALGGFFYFWKNERDHHVILLLILLVGFAAGLFAYNLSFPKAASVANATQVANRTQVSSLLSGVVVKASSSNKTQHLTLSQIKINDHQMDDRVLVFAPLFPEFDYGDQITLRCHLETPEPYEGFAHDRFLAAKNIYATCYTHEAPLRTATSQGSVIKAGMMQLRSSVIERIDQTFGEPHGSLLAGLLLGEQRFSEDWEQVFLRTGTTHIVAASGYNVSVATFIVSSILFALGIRRPRAFALIIAAIVAYVMLAGVEAPVVRAGVMGVLVLMSRQLGRKSTMTNVLLLTAALMLIANPRLLRDDVGFQLSMLSTVALIYFAPYLDQRFKFIPKAWTIRESFTATVAATLFTLPIIFISFGRLSIVGPFANLLILPAVPYAMAFGALGIVASFVSSSMGAIVSGPAWALLSYVLWSAESMAALPFASIEFRSWLAYPLAIFSSLAIIILWIRFSNKKDAPYSCSSP